MSNSVFMGLNNVCRTCLMPSDDMKSLYESCSTEIDMCLAEMLMFFTPLRIPVANDGLPTQICQYCLCELNQAYKFVSKCRKSDDELRNHLNTRDTKEAANTMAPNGINTTQTTNSLNANVKLDADMMLIEQSLSSDCSMKEENVKTFDDGRCSGDDFNSLSLNDSIESFNDLNKSLREPLPMSTTQADPHQQLELIKQDIDCNVRTERQPSVNYRNKDIQVNSSSVKGHENTEAPNTCRQTLKLLPKKETKKIYNSDEITSNQRENAMNMMNPVVILEDINVHLKYLKSPIQQQFEQTNSTVSKSINKIAIIAENGQISRKLHTSNRNAKNCTKMPVKPTNSYRVKPKSKYKAIDTTEETSTSATSRLIDHQVHTLYTCKFACTVCQKYFDNKRELTRHTQESPNPPDDIDKSITRKEDGICNVLKHTGRKLYVCNICGKVFPGTTGVTRHMLTHTGEKPYTCATCDKAFSLRGNLIRHMLTHTGQKFYSCVTCDKKFGRKDYFTLHLLTHTEKKPYTCEICSKGFIQKRTLVHHVNKHREES